MIYIRKKKAPKKKIFGGGLYLCLGSTSTKSIAVDVKADFYGNK